ncbi:M56 family metallopeptidase [Nonomuraea endophytica]|uniref:Zn-dependent protease with chaperone function n=1 Tax=Nonomuraea endophytica TaxID=714136 RepID=A0A7W8EKK2_9ACTN|nr:M56 family metallopeptidase [Nonomuraea endophytica]MBB5081927.1 Zn-dependent protease with chaperone function [Nonomuraea endophytica]
MFDHFVWSVVVSPPLIVLAAFAVAGRLAPALAARVLAWSAAIVAAAGMANLAVFAMKAVAEVPAVAQAMGWSAAVVRDDTARVPWVSWGSLVLLIVATAAAGWAHRRHRRDLRTARSFPRPEGDVLLVDDPAVTAFAVPGRSPGRGLPRDPGWVVVTTGMREALSREQYTALLAHERAHLAGAHHRLVRLAELAGAAHPALRWVSGQVGFLVERAADEQAAAEVGERRLVAQAVGRAALVAARARAGSRGALTPASSMLHAAGPSRPGVVPRRVAALLRPVPGTTALLWLVPALVAAGTVVWTGEAIYDLQELLRFAYLGRP